MGAFHSSYRDKKVHSESSVESKSPEKEDMAGDFQRINSENKLLDGHKYVNTSPIENNEVPADHEGRCKGPGETIDSVVNPTTTEGHITASEKQRDVGYWYYDVGASIRGGSWKAMEVATNTGKRLTGALHRVHQSKKKKHP